MWYPWTSMTHKHVLHRQLYKFNRKSNFDHALNPKSFRVYSDVRVFVVRWTNQKLWYHDWLIWSHSVKLVFISPKTLVAGLSMGNTSKIYSQDLYSTITTQTTCKTVSKSKIAQISQFFNRNNDIYSRFWDIKSFRFFWYGVLCRILQYVE